MKHEYHEGPEALEKFKKTVNQLFRVPKSTAKQPRRAMKIVSGLLNGCWSQTYRYPHREPNR